MDRSSCLLDEALGLDAGDQANHSPIQTGAVVLIEDCVETSGAFILHHLLKRALSPRSSGIVIFVAFAQPFSHYDRVLRKMGCNLLAQKDSNRFTFLDMRTLECPGGGDEGNTSKGGLVELYGKIQKAVEVRAAGGGNPSITIMVDDISLVEVAANGSFNHVLDFLHYLRTLTTEFGCSLVLLNHDDIYSCTETPNIILQMEYNAAVIIKAEPLATGLASDVHGQLTILNKGISGGAWSSKNKAVNFQFRIKENNVEYFYPGGRT